MCVYSTDPACAGNQQRYDGNWADAQATRRPEKGIDQNGNSGRVESNNRGQTGQHNIGHRLGNEHHRKGYAADQIALEVFPFI